MEINLFSFTPILIKKNNVKIYNSPVINYFLIQCFRTIIFVIITIFMSINLNYSINFLIKIFIIISIIIKLGFYPFYFWIIIIIKNISWRNCFILSTLQKIIPLLIIINLWSNFSALLILNIMNRFIRTLGGINNSNLKIIIAFSSINHARWILLVIIIFESLLYLYISIYFLINLSIIILFKNFNIKSIKNIYSIKYPNFIKIIFRVNFLSLGGIPPIFGFILKWISNLISKIGYYFYLNLILLIIISFITFFYYLFIIIPRIIFFNKSWNKYFLKFINFKKYNYIYILIFISTWIISLNIIIY